jgi:DNA-binding LytR/AlgR family response regulator
MIEQLDEILIVEDEPLIAEDISETLQEAGYGVSGIAHNANDAISILKSSSPSLVLLDIKIDGPIDGLMLGRIIKDDFNLPFIFLTSYTDKETVDKVKDLNPYGFIVKPFDERELTSNVEIAIHRFKSESKNLASIEEREDNESFFLKNQKALHKIKLDDILYAQAVDNYTMIYTEKSKFLVPQTLKSMEERLDSDRFIRTHRSYTVNFKYIDIITANHANLKGIMIPIGKGYKADLMNKVSLL